MASHGAARAETGSVLRISCRRGDIFAVDPRIKKSEALFFGHECTVVCDDKKVIGDGIVVFGSDNVVRGTRAVVHGDDNVVTGMGCIAHGANNTVCGTGCRAYGPGNNAFGVDCIVCAHSSCERAVPKPTAVILPGGSKSLLHIQVGAAEVGAGAAMAPEGDEDAAAAEAGSSDESSQSSISSASSVSSASEDERSGARAFSAEKASADRRECRKRVRDPEGENRPPAWVPWVQPPPPPPHKDGPRPEDSAPSRAGKHPPLLAPRPPQPPQPSHHGPLDYGKGFARRQVRGPPQDSEGIPGFLLTDTGGEDEKVAGGMPMCAVCLVNKARMLPPKCGHLCMCFACARAVIIGDDPKCPVCREKFATRLQRVFIP